MAARMGRQNGNDMSVVVLKPGEDSWTYPSRYDTFDKKLPVADRWYRRYRKSGKRYVRYLYDRLADCMVSEMHANVDHHFDNIVAVGGKEGKGKSHYCYYIAKMYDPDFTMEKGYIYDMYAFVDAITSGEDRGSVFWMDEATNLASNRDWNKEENKLFIQILEMARAKNWVLLLAIPLLGRLDIYLRDFRIRYRVVIEELSWDVNDRRVHRGYFYLTKASDFNDGPEVKVGWGRFPPMPPDIEKIYNEKYKIPAMENKFAEIKQRLDQKRGIADGDGSTTKQIGAVNRRLIVALRDSGVDYAELQRITGQSYKTLANSYSRGKKEQLEKGESD